MPHITTRMVWFALAFCISPLLYRRVLSIFLSVQPLVGRCPPPPQFVFGRNAPGVLLLEDAASVRRATFSSNADTFSSSLSSLLFKVGDESKGPSSRWLLAAGPRVSVKAGGGCRSTSLSDLTAERAALASVSAPVVFVAAEAAAVGGLALFFCTPSGESADIGFILFCGLLPFSSVSNFLPSSV